MRRQDPRKALYAFPGYQLYSDKINYNVVAEPTACYRCALPQSFTPFCCYLLNVSLRQTYEANECNLCSLEAMG